MNLFLNLASLRYWPLSWAAILGDQYAWIRPNFSERLTFSMETSERTRHHQGRGLLGGSGVLVVGLLKPVQNLGIHLLRRREADLETHGLLDLRRLEPPDQLLPLQAQAEIDPALRRRLHSGERSARGDERNVGLARLDGHLPQAGGRVDDGVEDGAEMRPIGVLAEDELVGGGQKEIRVAESLHDDESLRIPGYALLRQPAAEALLILEALSPDPPVPLVHVVPGALLEEPGRHLSHTLPVTRLAHDTLHSHKPAQRPRHRGGSPGISDSERPASPYDEPALMTRAEFSRRHTAGSPQRGGHGSASPMSKPNATVVTRRAEGVHRSKCRAPAKASTPRGIPESRL